MYRKIYSLLTICLSIVVLSACYKNKYSERLELALIFAGENRAELEKVLEHYSTNESDSLKYKAACFLIANMPGHYSYKDTVYINKYYDELDSLSTLDNFYIYSYRHKKESPIYKALRKKYNTTQLEYKQDIHYIKADYLIDNIERAFDVWQNNAWTEHVNFDDFCEYILPYKVTEAQTLDNWREYFAGYSNNRLNQIKFCDLYKSSAYKACEIVNQHICDSVITREIIDEGLPILRMRSLHKVPYATCADYSVLTLAIMRSKGIPTGIDFTPQWPFRSYGHSWNILLDDFGKNIVFEGAYGRPGMPHKEDHKMAKVFRKTYAINEEIENIHQSEGFIPSTFFSPFMKDVTEEYMSTCDITIESNGPKKQNYAYLAVFDNRNWIPIHWGKVNGKKVVFDKMGKGIVYLPMTYGEEGVTPISHPILLNKKDEIIELKPDTTILQTLTLERKFPVLPAAYEAGLLMKGGKIQASDDPDFKNVKTIYTIKECTTSAKEVIIGDTDQTRFRYWRYYSPDSAYCNISELVFFDRMSKKQIKGKIIGTEGSSYADDRYLKYAAFDGNPLTFFNAPSPSHCWVGMDFGEPVDIGRIVYTPRSDGNCIEIGDRYELLYWDDGGWKSLGFKTAENVTIQFKDCPTNALFLLKDHTKGVEERIFTYENNRQEWW